MGTRVSVRECRVWRGGEAIPAAIAAAFVVGVPLRLVLPVDSRYTLVVIVLAAMSATGVLVWPERIARTAVWLVRALARFAASLATPAPAMGLMQVRGHAHGTGSNLRRKIAKHEAGHAVAAEAVGGRVLSAEVFDGEQGGLVRARIPNTPLARATFLIAGQVAVNSAEGAGADNDEIRRVLRDVPGRERGQVKAQAKRDARRIVSAHSGAVRRYTRTLNEKGRL
jgi:hypothetical protein